jgi:hypothetical protein
VKRARDASEYRRFSGSVFARNRRDGILEFDLEIFEPSQLSGDNFKSEKRCL